MLMRWPASCAARSVTEKRAAGSGPMAEQGETDREVSRVEGALLESSDGDRAVSKVKLRSNIVLFAMGSAGEERGAWSVLERCRIAIADAVWRSQAESEGEVRRDDAPYEAQRWPLTQEGRGPLRVIWRTSVGGRLSLAIRDDRARDLLSPGYCCTARCRREETHSVGRPVVKVDRNARLIRDYSGR